MAVKPFSWSWSKLKNYRTCPKRHYHVDIAKEFKEEESDSLKWGNEVHDAMAKRCGDKQVPLPPMMQHYGQWPQTIDKLRASGLTIKVEQKLAMSEKFTPTSFFDAATWFRGVADVLGLATSSALTVDWKTGNKIQPDFEQLGLSAQLVFAHYPQVNSVSAIYVWLGHTNDDGTDCITQKTYTRDGMVPIWNDVWPWVKQMTEAHRTVTYPPKPSGLCVHYCPVTSCPHHGKGTR